MGLKSDLVLWERVEQETQTCWVRVAFHPTRSSTEIFVNQIILQLVANWEMGDQFLIKLTNRLALDQMQEAMWYRLKSRLIIRANWTSKMSEIWITIATHPLKRTVCHQRELMCLLEASLRTMTEMKFETKNIQIYSSKTRDRKSVV